MTRIRVPHPHLLPLVLGLALATAIVVPSAYAFDARSGEEITIGPDSVVDDDLYVAARSVTIDGVVRGDVLAAGQTVIVNGTVEGTLMAAGQTVIVNGTVRDTARVAAQGVQIGSTARVGRDLMFLGYSLETLPGSAIGRDVLIGGSQAMLAGTVDRDVRGGMAGLAVLGQVGRNVEVSVGASDAREPVTITSPPPSIVIPNVPAGLAVEPGAHIGGSLSYTSTREFPVYGAVEQGTHWTAQQPASPPQRTFGDAVADTVRRLIAIAIAGLLLLWLAPRWTEQMAATISARPLPSIGWGIVASFGALGVAIGICLGTMALAIAFGVITLPALAGLSLVVGFLAEAALLVSLSVFALLVSQAVVSFLGGKLLLDRMEAP